MVVALAYPVTMPDSGDMYSSSESSGVYSESRSTSVSPGLESSDSNSSVESVMLKEVVKHKRVINGRQITNVQGDHQNNSDLTYRHFNSFPTHLYSI